MRSLQNSAGNTEGANLSETQQPFFLQLQTAKIEVSAYETSCDLSECLISSPILPKSSEQK